MIEAGFSPACVPLSVGSKLQNSPAVPAVLIVALVEPDQQEGTNPTLSLNQRVPFRRARAGGRFGERGHVPAFSLG